MFKYFPISPVPRRKFDRTLGFCETWLCDVRRRGLFGLGSMPFHKWGLRALMMRGSRVYSPRCTVRGLRFWVHSVIHGLGSIGFRDSLGGLRFLFAHLWVTSLTTSSRTLSARVLLIWPSAHVFWRVGKRPF